jgi:hypothetical protein
MQGNFGFASNLMDTLKSQRPPMTGNAFQLDPGDANRP